MSVRHSALITANFKPSKIESDEDIIIELWTFSESGNSVCIGKFALPLFEPEADILTQLRLDNKEEREPKWIEGSMKPTKDGKKIKFGGTVSVQIAARPYILDPDYPTALNPGTVSLISTLCSVQKFPSILSWSFSAMSTSF